MRANALLTRPTDTQMNVNIPYSDMIRPEVGPSNPFSTKKLSQQNTLGGHVEETIMSDFDFRVQQRTFDNHGYARNPSTFASVTGQAYVGDARAAQANQGATALELRGGGSEGRATARELKKRRKGQKGDTSVVDGEGAYVGPWGGWDGEKIHTPVGPTEEEIERAEKLSTTRKKEEAEMQERRQKEEQAGTEKSVFHGESTTGVASWSTRQHVHCCFTLNVQASPCTTTRAARTCISPRMWTPTCTAKQARKVHSCPKRVFIPGPDIRRVSVPFVCSLAVGISCLAVVWTPRSR